MGHLLTIKQRAKTLGDQAASQPGSEVYHKGRKISRCLRKIAQIKEGWAELS